MFQAICFISLPRERKLELTPCAKTAGEAELSMMEEKSVVNQQEVQALFGHFEF